ncbi:hypothetical protein L208DRAFT_1009520, partial [Tricholoma matsutake]
AYSAVIQLYACSDQLDSAMHLHFQLHGSHCGIFESTHHIFTQCPCFLSLHLTSICSLHQSVTISLESFWSHLTDHPRLCTLLDFLFTDSDIWPEATSFYYRGLLPTLNGFLDDAALTHLTTLQCKWLLLHLATDCHVISICLAGQIWGI